MSYTFSGLLEPVSESICNYYGDGMGPYALEELLVLLPETHWPESLPRFDEELAWSRVILIFKRLGLVDADFKAFGATTHQCLQWQLSRSIPECLEFKRSFIKAMLERLRERAA